MKSSKKLSITLPPDLNRELQDLAKNDQRSLSGILQEASRYYLNIRHYEILQQELSQKARAQGVVSEADVSNLIKKVRKE